jgi:curved DNA-binding protein CbpA
MKIGNRLVNKKFYRAEGIIMNNPSKLFFLIITLSILDTFEIMTGMPPQIGKAQSPNMRPFNPPMPTFNGSAPGGSPFNQMPAPTEKEMEEIINFLNSAPPEVIEQLSRAGEEMLASMTDEELREAAPFLESMNVNPEEIREEARRAVAQRTTTEVPATPIEPRETYQPPTPTTPIIPEKPKVSVGEVRQTSALVQGIIEDLSALRQKAASIREVHEMVRPWLQDLRELMYYLRVIDRHDYHERLAESNYQRLLKTLHALHGALKTELPDIVLPADLFVESGPYDILGVRPSASEADIDKAYKKLAEKYNPSIIEKKLQSEGISEKDIKRQVKAATLNFEVIEDAYEQLKDKKSREQVDRVLTSQQTALQQKINQASNALKSITRALSQAIYSDDLLGDLERFLAAFAPQQLALKKELEAAEKKRLAEQEQLAKTRPIPTFGKYEPEFKEQTHSYPHDYGYFSDFPSYRHFDDNYPPFSYGPEREKGEGQKAGPDKEIKEDKDKEKKDKEDKDKAAKEKAEFEPTKKRAEESEKIDKRSVTEIMKEISNNLDTFSKVYRRNRDQNNNVKLLEEFKNYLAQETIEETTAPRTEVQIQKELFKELTEQPRPLTKKQQAEFDLLESIQDPSATRQQALTDQAKNRLEERPKPLTYAETKQLELLEEIKKEATTEKKTVPAPVDPTWNDQLHALSKDLKLEELAKEAKNLEEKMKIEKVKKMSKDKKEAWNTIEKKYSAKKGREGKVEQATELWNQVQALEEQLDTIKKKTNNVPAKIAAHQKAIDSMLEKIKSITTSLAGVDKIFKDAALEEVEEKEKSPLAT